MLIATNLSNFNFSGISISAGTVPGHMDSLYYTLYMNDSFNFSSKLMLYFSGEFVAEEK